MAVDTVVCPNCGKEALVTVPMGQQLVKIEKWRHDAKKAESTYNVSTCQCYHCKEDFWAVTKF